eukprot:6461031-Amphidinium_carterae.2
MEASPPKCSSSCDTKHAAAVAVSVPATPKAPRRARTLVTEHRSIVHVLNMRACGSLVQGTCFEHCPQHGCQSEYPADIAAPSSLGPNASAWASKPSCKCACFLLRTSGPVLPFAPRKN